jgi:hypothetical protein
LPRRAAVGRPAIRARGINRSVDPDLARAELAGIVEAMDALLMRYGHVASADAWRQGGPALVTAEG